MNPEDHGLTTFPTYQAFIRNWLETVAHTYMGGTVEEYATDAVKAVMDGDGGLLVALTILDNILSGPDIQTAECVAGDIGITLLKLGRSPDFNIKQMAYEIQEEP